MSDESGAEKIFLGVKYNLKNKKFKFIYRGLFCF